MGAESLGTLGRTSHVGQARVERDVTSVLNELIRRRVVTTMARAGHFSAAVEDELDGKIDLLPFALTSNLDAISQSRNGTMCPARTTVLWEVLIQTVGEVVGAINVAPSKTFWEGSLTDVLVRQSAENVIGAIVSLQYFDLVHPLLGRGDAHGQGSYGGKEDLHCCVVRAAKELGNGSAQQRAITKCARSESQRFQARLA